MKMRQNMRGAFEMAGALIEAKVNWRRHIFLMHAVTSRCNANCGFCAWKSHENSDDDMTTDEIKKLYTGARRAGFLALTMWGGEPLVRDDIGELARHAHSLGFSTNLVTNGFLLQRKMEQTAPFLDRISISVDYPSEQHDTARGVNGLYERIINATRKIRRKYPKKSIIYICTMFNNNTDADSIKKMAELMKTMGVAGVFNPLRDEAAAYSPGDHNLREFVASDEQLAEAFTLIGRLKKRGYPILNSYTYINMLRKGPPVYHCHWPKFILPIEANGDVVDCMYWGSRPVDNVKSKQFSEILKNPRLRQLAGKEGEQCHKCVSIHRIEISEVWEGNFEPLLSWAGRLL